MLNKIKKLWSDQKGAAMLEYILIIAVVVIVGLAVMMMIQAQIKKRAESISSAFEADQ
jgi:Flp pilus assembly pilin Flp